MLIMSSCDNECEDEEEENLEIWDTEEVCLTCGVNHDHYGTGYQAMLD